MSKQKSENLNAQSNSAFLNKEVFEKNSRNIFLRKEKLAEL